MTDTISGAVNSAAMAVSNLIGGDPEATTTAVKAGILVTSIYGYPPAPSAPPTVHHSRTRQDGTRTHWVPLLQIGL